MINLIFIGNQYYLPSGTRMSSLYELGERSNQYKRWDWGKVQIALVEGKEVRIRPANKKETEYFALMFQRNHGREM